MSGFAARKIELLPDDLLVCDWCGRGLPRDLHPTNQRLTCNKGCARRARVNRVTALAKVRTTVCPMPSKRKFVYRLDAISRALLDAHRDGTIVRVYPCPCRFFHLTHARQQTLPVGGRCSTTIDPTRHPRRRR